MARGKVLIIEDDKDWQVNLRKYLEEAGFFTEIVSTLEDGLQKIKNENFHFATIDLQLDEDTNLPSEFEGWKILEEIVKYRAERTMPTMVITGFDRDYVELKKLKNLSATFFMPKKTFDKKKFLETVITAVEYLNVRFYEDKKNKLS
jgi:ActR/RegA family two-component response regulator